MHTLREETGNIAISGLSAGLAIRKYKLHAVLFNFSIKVSVIEAN